MIQTLIKYNVPLNDSWRHITGEPTLRVSECFYDTIQGEGFSLGVPAAFLRLGGCHLGCNFCDTASVWKSSIEVGIDDLIAHIFDSPMAEKLSQGEHLVVTGGSPLLQQEALAALLTELRKRIPSIYIEVENECTIVPSGEMLSLANQWNNSPKLSNSGVCKSRRYVPAAISALPASQSFFKFVVSGAQDWEEIQNDFIASGLVRKEQIFLMPMGGDLESYAAARETIVEMATEHCVRYSPREHIAIWGDRTSV